MNKWDFEKDYNGASRSSGKLEKYVQDAVELRDKRLSWMQNAMMIGGFGLYVTVLSMALHNQLTRSPDQDGNGNQDMQKNLPAAPVEQDSAEVKNDTLTYRFGR